MTIARLLTISLALTTSGTVGAVPRSECDDYVWQIASAWNDAYAWHADFLTWTDELAVDVDANAPPDEIKEDLDHASDALDQESAAYTRASELERRCWMAAIRPSRSDSSGRRLYYTHEGTADELEFRPPTSAP